MQKLFTLFLLVLFFGFANGQTNSPVTRPAIVETLQLKEKTFDFGKIQQNRPVTHTFEIVNTGKEPLKLDNVQASCGCTTPEWSHDPIQPGASATIKVGYNAASEGAFSKNIAIQYNGTQTATIIISGTVYKGPESSAPLNSSINLLKQTNK
jgi:hypothetical protein